MLYNYLLKTQEVSKIDLSNIITVMFIITGIYNMYDC